ncbi:hypothetical protein LP7551_03899 [Roseibium album]|nr:hypothetical protein LP7551_03899 [Roseibium album]
MMPGLHIISKVVNRGCLVDVTVKLFGFLHACNSNRVRNLATKRLIASDLKVRLNVLVANLTNHDAQRQTPEAAPFTSIELSVGWADLYHREASVGHLQTTSSTHQVKLVQSFIVAAQQAVLSTALNEINISGLVIAVELTRPLEREAST